MTQPKLGGLIPAAVTPMTSAGDVDEGGLRRYARWLLSFEGLGGVAVNADTGEAAHLSADERRRVLEVWADEAGGRVPLVAGIGGPSTAAGAAAAREARRAGAAAVLVFPIPAYLGRPLDPELPYAYHRAIEEAAALPMVAFQLQQELGGVLFEDACLDRLFRIESIVAVKEASFDRREFVRMREAVRRAGRPITLLTGNDNFVLESLLLGAEGALIGLGTLPVAGLLAMVHAALCGDPAGAARMNATLGPLADAVFAPPVRDYRARTKYALMRLGVLNRDTVRAPLLPLSAAARAQMDAALTASGLLHTAAAR